MMKFEVFMISLKVLFLTESFIHGCCSGNVSRSCSDSMAAKLRSSTPPAFDTSRCFRIKPRDWTSRIAFADMIQSLETKRTKFKTELPKTDYSIWGHFGKVSVTVPKVLCWLAREIKRKDNPARTAKQKFPNQHGHICYLEHKYFPKSLKCWFKLAAVSQALKSILFLSWCCEHTYTHMPFLSQSQLFSELHGIVYIPLQ